MRLVSSASATATTRAIEARGEHLLHLGTGKRVLRAADDAAGLAVSTGLSLRARVATREVQSFQAGLRFTAAVEGDAEAVQAQLQRMRELAVASASEGSSAAARASMQVEFASALDEINRHGAAAAESADRIRLEAADPIPSLARMMAPRRVDLMTLVATAEGMGAAQRGLAEALPAFSARAAAAGADLAWGLAAAVQTVEGGSAAVDTADGLRTDRSIGLWSAAELQALIERFASDTLTRVGPDGERVAQHDPLRALLELAGLRDTAGQLEGDAAQWRPGAERHVLLVNNSLSDATSALEAVGTTRGLAEALARVGVVVHVASAVSGDDPLLRLAHDTGGMAVRLTADGDIGAMIEGVASKLFAKTADVPPGEMAARAAPALLAALSEAAPTVSIGGGESGIALRMPVDLRADALGLSGQHIADPKAARAALDAIDGALLGVGLTAANLGALSGRLGVAIGHGQRQAEAHTIAAGRIVDADVATEVSAAARAALQVELGMAARIQGGRIDRRTVEALLQPAAPPTQPDMPTLSPLEEQDEDGSISKAPEASQAPPAVARPTAGGPPAAPEAWLIGLPGGRLGAALAGLEAGDRPAAGGARTAGGAPDAPRSRGAALAG